LINESIYEALILEGRNDEKAHKSTLQIIRNFFNGGEWLDEEYVNPDVNPNHLSAIDYIYNKLHEMYFHAHVSDALIRLEPILMNVALSLGFEQQGRLDAEKMNRLTLIVNYIKSNYKKEGFPIQLNKLTLQNTTYESLNNLFGNIVDEIIEKDNANANNKENTQINPDYDIIEVKDFKTANKIGNYSCSTSKLCYTQSESTWEQYSEGNSVYCLLRKDYKEISEEHGENTPYDEYGLSMIFLFVNENGNLSYSNTRWNHNTNGNGPANVDQSFTKTDISNLLNVNFDDVFKQYEIDYNGYKIVDNNFYNGLKLVKLRAENKYNLVDENGNLTLNEFVNDIDDFFHGYAVVRLDGIFNFINLNGKLISNIWFDEVCYFYNGFALVRLNKIYNFIKENGELLSEKWFDKAFTFNNGFAQVYLRNEGMFYIDVNGDELTDKRFDNCLNFKDKIAIVILHDKYNFINTNGKLISNQWFDAAYNFNDGFASVQLNKKWNYIDKNGNFLSNKWFNIAYNFCNGCGKIRLHDKYNFINTNGDLISNQWFKYATDFNNGIAAVDTFDNEHFKIDKQGNIIGN
jgi:hypothetical protein